MTPTIGRIIHVGYDPSITNAGDLPCRAALVTGDVKQGFTPDKQSLPVTVFTPNRPPAPAYVDFATGWHDPRSCPRQQVVGSNDGQRSDPEPITNG